MMIKMIYTVRLQQQAFLQMRLIHPTSSFRIKSKTKRSLQAASMISNNTSSNNTTTARTNTNNNNNQNKKAVPFKNQLSTINTSSSTKSNSNVKSTPAMLDALAMKAAVSNPMPKSDESGAGSRGADAETITSLAVRFFIR